MNDIHDIEWRCESCGHVNADFDDRCNECIERRYPAEEEPLDSGPGLYESETHRMVEAQALKR